MLGGKEEQPFERFNLLFGEYFFLSFLALKLSEFISRFVTIRYENKFSALSNHVPNRKLK